ncbi:MAG: helix-turn-helix domain-containing protein [Pseudonocardiaceae bacterium]
MIDAPGGVRSPTLMQVLRSAARLQELVPDAVLVGDSTAALYAGHRDSYDHDHVLADLADRFNPSPVQEPRGTLAGVGRGRLGVPQAGDHNGGGTVMSLAFRNLDLSPEGPVELWPTEAILTALERGGLGHWRRLTAAIYKDPWGPVARRVQEALEVSRPYGVGVLMTDVLTTARTRAEHTERAEVAAEITQLLAASGLARAEFAAAIGTSTSRLSTYLNGKVTPSAGLLVRMRRVAARRAGPVQ